MSTIKERILKLALQKKSEGMIDIQLRRYQIIEQLAELLQKMADEDETTRNSYLIKQTLAKLEGRGE